MRDFRRATCDKLRQKWLESLALCNALFARYNDLCDEIKKYDFDLANEFDGRHFKNLIDQRLVVESELVAARVECRRAYHEYYYEFPFLAAFENLGGDTN